MTKVRCALFALAFGSLAIASTASAETIELAMQFGSERPPTPDGLWSSIHTYVSPQFSGKAMSDWTIVYAPDSYPCADGNGCFDAGVDFLFHLPGGSLQGSFSGVVEEWPDGTLSAVYDGVITGGTGQYAGRTGTMHGEGTWSFPKNLADTQLFETIDLD